MAGITASAVFPYLGQCKKQLEKAIDGQVQGEIPKWLKGSLIRIGSGLLEVGPDSFNNVFEGSALMHKFTFEDGRVTYQNRFLRIDSYTTIIKANRKVSSEIGSPGVPDPCKTIFQRFFSLFSLENLSDNDLFNLIVYTDEPYACSESNCIWKIDPDNLENLETVDLNRHLHVNAAIAHSHEDTDGTVYNMGSTFSLNCSYNILKFPHKENKEDKPFQNASVVYKIPSSKFLALSYHHSFAMSENYFVFVEHPLYRSVPKIAGAHFMNGTYADSLYCDPKDPTRFHVVRRSDMQLLDTVYISKPFFVFHHINMYEEDSHLKVDLCAYNDGEVVKSLYVKALEEMFFNPKKTATDPFVSKVERFILPLNVGSDKATDVNLVNLPNTEAKAFKNPDGHINLVPEVLTGSESWSAELPRINYDFNGKEYRYSYSVGRPDQLKRTHLIKVDAVNKTVIHWSEEGAIPSGPVFISDPDSKEKSEDSGVILASLLYQNDEAKVSMVVLDAKSMKEIGRVTFKTE